MNAQRRRLGIAVVLLATACRLGWEPADGAVTLASRTGPAGPSRELTFDAPDGWHWFRRGDDWIATKDGVFLQNILVERIQCDQTEQPTLGAFPLAALSAKQWPIRTVRHLSRRFAPGMAPADAAAALFESRACDPAIVELSRESPGFETLGGVASFRSLLAFRLVPPGSKDLEWAGFAWSPYDVHSRPIPYRSVCCGFVVDDWFYGVTYTGARRRYFDEDLATFERFLRSLRVAVALPPVEASKFEGQSEITPANSAALR